jgi:type I restriction enzyme S subunit
MNWVKLGDVLKITSGGTPKSGVREYYGNGTIAWVKTGDLKIRHLFDVPDKITDAGLKNSSAKIFPVNTVLMAMYGASIGNCSILKVEAATNQACAAFLPNEKVNEEFLYFFLQSIKKKLISQGIGGGQPNISGTILKETKFPFLPINQQRQIALLLSRAEGLISARQRSLALLDELLKSAFLDLFGDPVKNEKGWEVGKISDLVERVSYGTSKPSSDKGRYKYLRMNNISYQGDWDFSNIKYIDLDEKEASRYLVQKNDLIFNRTNSSDLVGKTAVFRENESMAIAGYLVKAKTNFRANPEYVSAYLNSDHGKRR